MWCDSCVCLRIFAANNVMEQEHYNDLNTRLLFHFLNILFEKYVTYNGSQQRQCVP